MRQKKEFVLNAHYIRVCMCCASCAHKEITREIRTRRCSQNGEKVKPTHVCRKWQMSDMMQKAGLSGGVVRDMKTKDVLIN